jgi:glutamate racemase
MFDSGVGGLTVLHECLVTMPHEDFLYAGDTAHFPYGGRSADELRGFAQEIAGWLAHEGVKLIVVACNSATATALGDLQRTLEVPVIGVLTPEARAAVQLTRNRRVGLLATEATIATGRYRDLVHALDAGIELVEVACPGLADAIQRGEAYDETMVARVAGHCAPLREAGVDTVILGCTHYPLIRGMLQRELGRDVALVSAAEELAEEVAATLARKRIARDHGRRGSYRFACTGDAEAFASVGRRFLQLPISSVRALGARELAGLSLATS